MIVITLRSGRKIELDCDSRDFENIKHDIKEQKYVDLRKRIVLVNQIETVEVEE